MVLKLYQVDAFCSEVFGGNPAAVCPLEEWLDDDIMQKIANENNLSETAFFVRENDHYHIRWFTPSIEVDLCGHATLGSSYVIFNELGYEGSEIIFHSRSGELKVTRSEGKFTLNFPVDKIQTVDLSDDLLSCFNAKPVEIVKGKTDYMFIYDNEETIHTLKPNLLQIGQLEARGVIVTSKGNEVDFVSRFFGPQSGVDEDPVTGSAHTTLTPYWSERLGKTELSARQVSRRGGELTLKLDGDRVYITGSAAKYLEGNIFL